MLAGDREINLQDKFVLLLIISERKPGKTFTITILEPICIFTTFLGLQCCQIFNMYPIHVCMGYIIGVYQIAEIFHTYPHTCILCNFLRLYNFVECFISGRYSVSRGRRAI